MCYEIRRAETTTKMTKMNAVPAGQVTVAFSALDIGMTGHKVTCPGMGTCEGGDDDIRTVEGDLRQEGLMLTRLEASMRLMFMRPEAVAEASEMLVFMRPKASCISQPIVYSINIVYYID